VGNREKNAGEGGGELVEEREDEGGAEEVWTSWRRGEGGV